MSARHEADFHIQWTYFSFPMYTSYIKTKKKQYQEAQISNKFMAVCFRLQGRSVVKMG